MTTGTLHDEYYVTSLGEELTLDFHPHLFHAAPAMVKKDPVNGMRMCTKYDPEKYSPEEYDIIEGMWDHEHCAVCYAKFVDGDTYMVNSRDQILCEDCLEKVKKDIEQGGSPNPLPPSAPEDR